MDQDIGKKVVTLAWSEKKGTRKELAAHLQLIENFGVEGDAHAGPWHRQVSFLSSESILSAKQAGLDVSYGDFAENIATSGIDWPQVPVGTRVKIGDHAIIEITQIGKECHRKCAIFYQAGDCIMPREGVFGRVLKGGPICCGDSIEFLSASQNPTLHQPPDSNDPVQKASEQQYTDMEILHWCEGVTTSDMMSLISEEPLSIRVQGKPYTVIMRTPGDEVAHAAGFCLGEGLIDTRKDFTAIGVCEGENRNVATITLTRTRMQMVADRLDRRQLISQTSCGICGKEIVEDLHQLLQPLPDSEQLETASALACLENITKYQFLRKQTKASHAAVVYNNSCQMIASAEDVGRHNALDKVIGKLFLGNKLENARLLVLSSRISYEMVQKAARARIPVILAMSRPTDLAIRLAQSVNMTLGCLSADDDLLIFTASHRLSG